MAHIHDTAIVLRRLDYSETSLVLTVFTKEHGQVRVIAKGARRSTRKRFSPGVDLLECGSIVLSVRETGQEAMAILVEWKQQNAYYGLRDGLSRWLAAQYVADVVAKLTEVWDPHSALFDAIHSALAAFANADDVIPPLVLFQRTLLDEIGLLPRLDSCISCGRSLDATSDVYFSSFEGGLLCRDCEPARVEKRLLRARPAMLIDLASAGRPDIEGVFDLYNYHLSHHMGRAPAAGDALLQHCRHLSPRSP